MCVICFSFQNISAQLHIGRGKAPCLRWHHPPAPAAGGGWGDRGWWQKQKIRIQCQETLVIVKPTDFEIRLRNTYWSYEQSGCRVCRRVHGSIGWNISWGILIGNGREKEFYKTVIKQKYPAEIEFKDTSWCCSSRRLCLSVQKLFFIFVKHQPCLFYLSTLCMEW